MTSELLWPRYANPGDLSVIEAVPLQDRGLPQTSYALLTRTATLWPQRTAVTVLPAAARWKTWEFIASRDFVIPPAWSLLPLQRRVGCAQSGFL